MFNLYESNGFFENRAYFAADTVDNIKSNVNTDNGNELYGAGCRSYGKITGFFMSLFGTATKMEISGKPVYVNNSSFAKLVERLSELKDEDKTSPQKAAKRLQDLYLEHKKRPYKNVDKVRNDFKRIIKNKEIKDFGQMILRLDQIAKI